MPPDTAAEAGTWHKSACIPCENHCGVQILTVEGQRTFRKIRGGKDHVSAHGHTCNKALRLDHYQNGGRRPTTPLRREAGGTCTPADWDTAIVEVAQRFAAARGYPHRHRGPTLGHRPGPTRPGFPLPTEHPNPRCSAGYRSRSSTVLLPTGLSLVIRTSSSTDTR